MHYIFINMQLHSCHKGIGRTILYPDFLEEKKLEVIRDFVLKYC